MVHRIKLDVELGLTEYRRKVEEAERKRADQSRTSKSQAIIEIHELEQTARDKPNKQEPALRPDELILAFTSPEMLDGDYEELYCRFGENERHPRQDARGCCEG